MLVCALCSVELFYHGFASRQEFSSELSPGWRFWRLHVSKSLADVSNMSKEDRHTVTE